MTSYIVVSLDDKSRKDYIEDFCSQFNIDKFDKEYITKENSKNLDSIGLESIKDISKKINFKPINSKLKAVIIENSHLLTIQAQNALLKVLEEPPNFTFIILSTQSTESLLPTVISRCQIVNLSNTKLKYSDEENSEFEKFINALADMKVGEKLKKAEELAQNKDNAIEWIEKIILVLRKKLLEMPLDAPNAQDSLATLRSLQSLHTLLKTTNVNPRFAMETTLINL